MEQELGEQCQSLTIKITPNNNIISTKESITDIENIKVSVTSDFYNINTNASNKSDDVKPFIILNQISLIFELLFKKSCYHKFPPPPEILKIITNPIEDFFLMKERKTTIENECQAGFVSFLACIYCVPIISKQMNNAGYSYHIATNTCSLLVAVSTIICGFLTNTPLVIAPPGAFSIYLFTSMESHGLSPNEGSKIVFYCGCLLFCIGISKNITKLIANLMPELLQNAIFIGIGFFTAFQGLKAIDLIIRGNLTYLSYGKLTDTIYICFSAVVISSIAKYYKSKYVNFIALIWSALIWWTANNWPFKWISNPSFTTSTIDYIDNQETLLLIFEIALLNLLITYGLAIVLLNRAQLIPEEGSIKHGQNIMMLVGLMNILSGGINGPPIAVLAEGTAGIQAGGRTGFCAILCGILFSLTIFFGPLLSSIPTASTSAVLIMIGLAYCRYLPNIDFINSKYALSAYITIILIPFTQCVMTGAGFGFASYIIILILSSDLNIFIRYFTFQYMTTTIHQKLEQQEDENINIDNDSIVNEKNVIEEKHQI